MQVFSPIGAMVQARIHSSREALTLLPSGASRLLILLDPSLQPEPVLGIAFELSERWDPKVTLMHGGLLELDGEPEPETDQAKLTDLLCLCWQMRESFSDISISRKLPRSIEDVFAEAAERRADLILMSDSVMRRTGNAVNQRLVQPSLLKGADNSGGHGEVGERRERSKAEPTGISAPCPVLVVTSSGLEFPEAQVATEEWFR